MYAQSELLQVVPALRAAGGFTGGLHRGQEQSHENPNNRNHYEELHKREASHSFSAVHRRGLRGGSRRMKLNYNTNTDTEGLFQDWMMN
jgi:hypothetical protein